MGDLDLHYRFIFLCSGPRDHRDNSLSNPSGNGWRYDHSRWSGHNISISSSGNRGRAIGYVITAASVGLALGPVIGGFLTVYFGWRWIFLVNVPLGIVAMLLGFKALPRDQKLTQGSFDLLGAGLIFASLALVIYGLNQGHELGWESNSIRGSFSLGILCAIGFFLRERRYPEPLVDLMLFYNLDFILPNLGALLMLLAFAGALFVLPFYMEMALGLSTVVASFFLTIVSIAAATSAPIGGTIYDRLGPRFACLIATASSLLAFLLLFFLSGGEFQRITLLLALALIGVGYGMYAPPTLSIVLSLCPQKQGQASSIMMTCRDMGVIIGTALFETVFGAIAQSESSIHQASSQIIALGFHQVVLLGIMASLLALVISLAIRNKVC